LKAKKRDNFTCVLCSSTKAVEGHHIIPVKIDLSLVGELTNIITLCKECHYKAHDGNTQGPVNEDIKNQLLVFNIVNNDR
jgi:5-methylcytosine-specific restriction endonuclease McrA